VAPRCTLASLVALLLVPSTVAHADPLSVGPVARNPADRLAALPPDPERYDHSRRCTRRAAPGTLALERWLAAHWRGASWGILRCERLSKRDFSLHADGRALDWHLDAAVRPDARAARRLVSLLLAPDRLGTAHALARRMGVQEIIWDCRAWWAGGTGMDRYSVCARGRVDRTTAHRDHVHLGLSRPGAAARTSFWTSGAGRR
jgi:hypothetical protein